MLQVITKRFSTTQEHYETHQEAVLYTNYKLFQTLETVVGTVTEAESTQPPHPIIYKYTQFIEKTSNQNQEGALVAVHSDYIIEDFAAILSFALRAIVTSDHFLAHKLIQSSHPSPMVFNPPQKYIKRFFSPNIQYNTNETKEASRLIKEIINLPRKNYLSILRAIKRYIGALHRVGDDLTLSYTLLVASIESLAQDFDNFKPQWTDYPDHKRNKIDKIFQKVDSKTANELRDELLRHEHLALGKRFQNFALQNIKPSLFRNESKIRRIDLNPALQNAYKIRSKNIHQLHELPKELMALSRDHNEVVNIENQPFLTLQGLSNLTHHIILNHIENQPKIEQEEYNYWSEVPGIITMPLAPKYWVHNPAYFELKTSHEYLAGMLSELATSLKTKTPMTNITEILKKIEAKTKGLAKPEQRIKLKSIYLIWHSVLHKDAHRPNWEKCTSISDEDFNTATIESF